MDIVGNMYSDMLNNYTILTYFMRDYLLVCLYFYIKVLSVLETLVDKNFPNILPCHIFHIFNILNLLHFCRRNKLSGNISANENPSIK